MVNFGRQRHTSSSHQEKSGSEEVLAMMNRLANGFLYGGGGCLN